jgi:hypothetical protein
MTYMSIDALAGRVKKVAKGKGKQSKIKMLIFYYALKAANLLKLASYSLEMIKLMDLELFNELSLDIGMSITALQNEILVKNENTHPHSEQEREINKIKTELKTQVKTEIKTDIKIKKKNCHKDTRCKANIENVVINEKVKVEAEIIYEYWKENDNNSRKRGRVVV